MTLSRFEFTSAAKEDLAHIARYTSQKWGKPQAMKYAGLLDSCFQKIGQGQDTSKSIIPNREDIRVCRCEHHYVFYLRKNQTAIILAVLHERMDMIERLKKCLPI